jgi:hypothetical protein
VLLDVELKRGSVLIPKLGIEPQQWNQRTASRMALHLCGVRAQGWF